MESILVPIDFSTISKNALTYAISLAEKMNAKIILIHAHQIFPLDPGLIIKEHKDEVEVFRRVSEIKLKELREEIENTSTVKCDFVSIQGLAKDIIVEYVNDNKPDLLIIGTEKLMPIERIMYGTITGKLIKEVECPLLIIPEDVKYYSPNKIAFAMDYHDSDLNDILFVEKLSEKFKSETRVVHVSKDNEDKLFEENYFMKTQEDIKKRTPKNKTTFYLIHGNNISEELERYVKEEGIDILAVAKTKKSFLERLFSGSVSQKLFYHSKMPLLIFEAKDLSFDLI